MLTVAFAVALVGCVAYIVRGWLRRADEILSDGDWSTSAGRHSLGGMRETK